MILDAALLAQARDRIAAARQIFVLTGAGVSAESGVPTFRDALTGLWARFDPEDLATEAAFRRQPALVWQWYEHRRAMVSATQPNPRTSRWRGWRTRNRSRWSRRISTDCTSRPAASM